MSKTEWKEYTLDEVCSRLSSGKNIPASEVFEKGLFPVYGGNGLRGYADKSNFDGDCAIIGRQGAFCGNVRFFSGKGYMTEHAVVVCGNEKSDTRYLSYLLSTMQLGRLSGQSAQPGLAVGTLAKQKILLPPLVEQQRIAKILSSLDDKIELNNAINRNLEEQAQAIFKSWFVDFESFGGKMPEDWKLGKLGDVAEIKKKAFHPEKNPGLIVEHYSLPALDEKHYPVFEVADGIKSNKFVVSKESVLISKLNPDTKRIWRPYCISENPICSTEFVVFESIKGSHRDFLYSIIDSQQFYDFMGSLVTGCTNSHQRVSPETLLTFPIAIPPKTILKSFCDKITPIYEMIEKNVLENQRLTGLRDALLPKLMSKESTKN